MNPSNSAAKVIAQSRERAERLGQIRRVARQAEKRLRQDTEDLRESAESIAKAQELASYGIPGFFPTPRLLARRMMEIADLQAGMTVLEPSAGAGHIADVVPQFCTLTLVESNWTLCELLRKKGYVPVHADFLEWQGGPFDRILMNPPFESQQDIDHIQHAFDLLAPGGRLVSIASAGALYRSDRKAKAFREWLEELGADVENLPADTFKFSDRPTGVQTCLITIDR